MGAALPAALSPASCSMLTQDTPEQLLGFWVPSLLHPTAPQWHHTLGRAASLELAFQLGWTPLAVPGLLGVIPWGKIGFFWKLQ